MYFNEKPETQKTGKGGISGKGGYTNIDTEKRLHLSGEGIQFADGTKQTTACTVSMEELGKEKYELFETQSKFLLGKILTIIDASLQDQIQRKAVKDIIKQQFYEQQKHVYRICTGHHMLEATGEAFSPFRVQGPLKFEGGCGD